MSRALGRGLLGTVEARAAELQRRIGDVVAALDLCCRAALRPAGLGQLGGRSAALEEGCRVDPARFSWAVGWAVYFNY